MGRSGSTHSPRFARHRRPARRGPTRRPISSSSSRPMFHRSRAWSTNTTENSSRLQWQRAYAVPASRYLCEGRRSRLTAGGFGGRRERRFAVKNVVATVGQLRGRSAGLCVLTTLAVILAVTLSVVSVARSKGKSSTDFLGSEIGRAHV